MKKLGFVFYFVFTMYLIGSSQVVEITSPYPVPMIKQMRSQWCWAACAEMIDSFYFPNRSRTQCDMAKYYMSTLYNIPNSLSCPSDSTCDEFKDNWTGNVYFSFPNNYFGNRYEKLLSYNGLYSSFEISPTIQEIKSEIESSRPLIVILKLSSTQHGSSSHMVVVKGYDDKPDGTYLLVNDPWFHTSGCAISPLLELNYNAINNGTDPTVKSFMAFQINIHPKLAPISSATISPFRRTSFQRSEKSIMRTAPEDTITIPVKVLSIDKLNGLFRCFKRNKFLSNEVEEKYLPKSQKSIVREKTSKGWVTTEIRQSNYPIQLSATKGKDSLNLDNIGNGKVTLWQYPAPPFAFFYAFQHNGKTVVTPLTSFNTSKKSTKAVEVGKYYSEQEIFNRLASHNRIFFGKGIFSNLNLKGFLSETKNQSSPIHKPK